MNSQAFSPYYENLVNKIIQSVNNDTLAEMRRDFHTRMRITLNQPNESELVEDLWDFFYDWCIFEQKLPENLKGLTDEEKNIWEELKNFQQRSLYQVVKVEENLIRLKDLYTGKTFYVIKKDKSDFVGISRGDFLEARLVKSDTEKEKYLFTRKPSYHQSPVHSYIKKKVKQFKKSKDVSTFQTWLWLLVGMYLKHRIYSHMPVEKIYDDQSRI
jgi:hypothetical protein